MKKQVKQISIHPDPVSQTLFLNNQGNIKINGKEKMMLGTICMNVLFLIWREFVRNCQKWKTIQTSNFHDKLSAIKSV